MISLDRLSFGWPNAPLLYREISLTLPKAQVIAVLGPNGAGKSTLLRLVAGLEAPRAGHLRLANGMEPALTPPATLARLIGAVFQASDRHFLRSRVLDEIALGPRKLGLSDPDGLARRALARLELSEIAEAHPLDLDAGARRLVSLATAIVHGPQILLLDEGQRGLDQLNRDRLIAVMAEERARGTTILSVSHDRDFTRQTASLALDLREGGMTLGPVDAALVPRDGPAPDPYAAAAP